MQVSKHKILALCAGAAILFTLVVFGDRYLWKRATKIDDTVTMVTLDDVVIVMQKGEPPRITKVRPPVVPPRDIRPNIAKPPIKWTLPYSCSDVHFYSSHFTKAQLEAMRKAAGMAMPSAEQRAQIQACLAGRVK